MWWNKMKILPVSLEIPVNAYLHHAHLNSLILGQNPQSYMWLNNKYLQLYFNKKNTNVMLDFFTFEYMYDCLDTGYVKSFLINSVIDIKNIIENSIDHNYYITCLIDEFYVNKMAAYKKWHFNHWCLIYGYDDINYLCLGYLKDGKYQKFELSINEFLSSFIKIEYGLGLNTIKENYNFCDEISGIKLLYDYTYGLNTSENYGLISHRIDGSYGIKIYDSLIEEKDGKIDVRYAHVLLEHKYCVHRYLINESYDLNIINEYEKIIKYCHSLKWLSLKQRLSYDLNTAKRIDNLLKKTQDEEYKILSKII